MCSFFCKLVGSIKQHKINTMAFDIQMIEKVYATMAARVDKARELIGRPLTLTEKILYSHLWE